MKKIKIHTYYFAYQMLTVFITTVLIGLWITRRITTGKGEVMLVLLHAKKRTYGLPSR